MEGELGLYKNLIQGYSQKYCILHKHTLLICEKKGGDVEGKLHFGVCTIKPDHENLVIGINTGLDEIKLKVETLDNFVKWSNAMTSSKKDYLDQSQRDQAISNLLSESVKSDSV
jgi:hypothetical protein